MGIHLVITLILTILTMAVGLGIVFLVIAFILKKNIMEIGEDNYGEQFRKRRVEKIM